MQAFAHSYRLILLLMGLVLTMEIQALTQPAGIKRICLNNNDTLATISWTMPDDLCNSYERTEIYGRRQTDPYRLLALISDVSIEETSIKLSSLEQSWSFFIVLHTACNGIDSLISDTIGLDIVKPPLNPLDSVSIDFNTQKIIAGWQRNNANDIKGYRLYRFSNAVNDSIGDTENTSIIFQNVNSESAPQISLAAYDSCNLYSAISAPHQIVRLNVQGLGPCTDSVILSWTNYVGWNGVSEYEVHRSLNASAYERHHLTNATSFTDVGINYGDSVCYFIRAKHPVSAITSSSLIKCYQRYEPEADPNYALLNWSASESDQQMLVVRQKSRSSSFSKEEVEIIHDNSVILNVFKPDLSEDYSEVSLAQMSFGISTTKSYAIVLKAYDICHQQLQFTDTFRNVVLEKEDNNQFLWNPFGPFLPEGQQDLVYSVNRSTWNIFRGLATEQFTTSIDDASFETQYCFRIRTENALYLNSPYSNFSGQLENLSNILCLSGDFKFYVPNALHTQGQNNAFFVEGIGINREESEMIIFNRWGEQVHRSDLTNKWMPKETSYNFGDYFYQITVKGFKGEKEHLTGRIYVIP